MRGRSRWTMVDAVKVNRRDPNGFPIPTEAERFAIRVGMEARIAFEDGEGGWDSIWLVVGEVRGNDAEHSYLGRVVDGSPYPDGPAAGVLIAFEPRHVSRIIDPIPDVIDLHTGLPVYRSIA